MRWPVHQGNNWKRRFALFPTQCGNVVVWLEWYWACSYGEGVWREADDPRTRYP